MSWTRSVSVCRRLRTGGKPLGKLRKLIGKQRIPGGGIRGELVHDRTDAGVGVERSHAHAQLLRICWISRIEMAAALAAEELLPTIRGPPRGDELGPFDQPKRAWDRRGGCRERGSRPPLTATAVAVEGGDERRTDLEANLLAHTPAGQGLEPNFVLRVMGQRKSSPDRRSTTCHAIFARSCACRQAIRLKTKTRPHDQTYWRLVRVILGSSHGNSPGISARMACRKQGATPALRARSADLLAVDE